MCYYNSIDISVLIRDVLSFKPLSYWTIFYRIDTMKTQHTIFDTPVIKTLARWLSLIILKVIRWEKSGTLPEIQKFVMIAAPHTSNWDMPLTLIIAFAFRLKIYWMGKKEIFRWPIGPVARWLGGIPINRSKNSNMVNQVIEVLKKSTELVVTIPPEGTRKQVRYWKTGFYYIAHGAGVPILLGFLDYKRKLGGVGPLFYPTGNIENDMNEITAFYETINGRYPFKSVLPEFN